MNITSSRSPDNHPVINVAQPTDRTLRMDDFKLLLWKYQSRWIMTSGKGKKKKIQHASVEAELVLEMIQHGETLSTKPIRNREKLKKMIRKWYKANPHVDEAQADTIKTLGLGEQWNLRRVVWYKMKEDINLRILDLLGDNYTPSQYIGAYQRATTQVISELSAEEEEGFLKLVTEWNVRGPPDDIKKLMAKRYAAQYLQSFVDNMKSQLGMEVMIFSGWTLPDGKVQTNRVETSHSDDHDNFMSLEMKMVKDLYQLWTEHVEDSLDDRFEDDDFEDQERLNPLRPVYTKPRDKGMPLVLPVNSKGIKTLHRWSDLTSQNGWKIKPIQALFRSFVTYYYRQAVKNSTTSFCWTQFAESPELYIEASSLPNLGSDHWLDPSHLSVSILEKAINFFCERADDGINPPISFVASHVTEKQAARGRSRKRKDSESEDSDDEETQRKHRQKNKRRDMAALNTDDEETLAILDALNADSSDLENDELPIPSRKINKVVPRLGQKKNGDVSQSSDHSSKVIEDRETLQRLGIVTKVIEGSVDNGVREGLDLRLLGNDSWRKLLGLMSKNAANIPQYGLLIHSYHKSKIVRTTSHPPIEPLPKWASNIWNQSKFLDEQFHKEFDSVMEVLTSGRLYLASDGKLVSRDHMEQFIVAIGAAMQEINTVNDLEPDADDPNIPAYVLQSTIHFSRRAELEESCLLLSTRLQATVDSPIDDTSAEGPSSKGSAVVNLKRTRDHDSSNLQKKRIRKIEDLALPEPGSKRVRKKTTKALAAEEKPKHKQAKGQEKQHLTKSRVASSSNSHGNGRK